MALKTKYTDFNFPIVDNNVRTTKSPLIGFEWEIPLNLSNYGPYKKWQRDNGCDEDCDCYDCMYEYVEYGLESADKWASANGFAYHAECGGLEFASPITNTVAVARRAAKALNRFAKNKSYLDPSGVYSDCGIHVHVSLPGRCGYDYKVFEQLYAMLNRESSYNFMYQFSGRANGSTWYRKQGQSSKWDRGGATHTYGMRYTNEMLRCNGHGTIEYRIWHSDEKLLIPAIEFAHSTFKFIQTKPYTGLTRDVPYLKDYKKWLMKQPGYKTLKETAPWSLING